LLWAEHGGVFSNVALADDLLAAETKTSGATNCGVSRLLLNMTS
jgi:hypothetical protein